LIFLRRHGEPDRDSTEVSLNTVPFKKGGTMKKSNLYLCSILFVLISFSAVPGRAENITPPPVVKDEDQQTILNDTTDFFATLGKDPDEKEEILKERKQERKETRLKEKARRKKRALRKQMKDQQDAIMEKIGQKKRTYGA
jgi:hypothetical protein